MNSVKFHNNLRSLFKYILLNKIQMGFDAFLFGRADYQDIAKRRAERNVGMVWRGNAENLGEAADIYTEILPNGYSPPRGFCFDELCSDDPIMVR